MPALLQFRPLVYDPRGVVNLANNPSFESNATGYNLDTDGAGTMARDSTKAPALAHGGQALKYTNSGGTYAGWYGTEVGAGQICKAVKPGLVYHVSIYVYHETGSPQSFSFGVNSYTAADGNQVSQGSDSFSVPTNVLTRIGFATSRITPGNVALAPWLYCAAAGFTFWCDALQITEGPVMRAFVPS